MTCAAQIEAIRSVRLAAHELTNVCAAIIGGTEMAVSVTTVEALGQPIRGLAPKCMEQRKGGT